MTPAVSCLQEDGQGIGKKILGKNMYPMFLPWIFLPSQPLSLGGLKLKTSLNRYSRAAPSAPHSRQLETPAFFCVRPPTYWNRK
jgi:hypothetical protein